jgi:hypothetical protein
MLKSRECEFASQYKTKMLHQQKPSEARFLSQSALMIKEEDQSAHLEFSGRHCRRYTSGTLVSSTMSDWGCLILFPTKHPSEVVGKYCSAD